MWYRWFKTYHLVAIGGMFGLLVGVSRNMSADEPALGGPGFISQDAFLRALKTPPINGKPYVRSVAIRPSKIVGGIDVVSFEALDTATDSYRMFLLAAPRPFAVNGVAPSDGYTVWDYLQSASVSNPAVTPYSAWWEQTPATLGFYSLLGVLIIGVAWPMCLKLTAKEDRSEDYDLDRFTQDQPYTATAGTTPDTGQQLQELDDELARGLAEPEVASVPPPPQPEVRKLDTSPYVPVTIRADDDEKDYAGEFYPVEKHAPHGFSLVELIVVVGIIVLLFSFLMPALRQARLAAQQVKCADNLRSIGQGLHQYAGANGGWLPAWSGWHVWPADPTDDTPAWTVEMIPYLGLPTSPVYNCPSFPRAEHYRNYFLESQWSGRSGRSAMKLTDIKLSGRFIISGDKTNMGLYPGVANDDTDPDDYGGAGALLWPWSGGFYMHRTGNNVLFDDGHVELCSKFDPIRMTFNPHRVEDHDQVTPD